MIIFPLFRQKVSDQRTADMSKMRDATHRATEAEIERYDNNSGKEIFGFYRKRNEHKEQLGIREHGGKSCDYTKDGARRSHHWDGINFHGIGALHDLKIIPATVQKVSANAAGKIEDDVLSFAQNLLQHRPEAQQRQHIKQNMRQPYALPHRRVHEHVRDDLPHLKKRRLKIIHREHLVQQRKRHEVGGEIENDVQNKDIARNRRESWEHRLKFVFEFVQRQRNKTPFARR